MYNIVILYYNFGKYGKIIIIFFLFICNIFIYLQRDSFSSSFSFDVSRNLFSLETKDGVTSQSNAGARGYIRY